MIKMINNNAMVKPAPVPKSVLDTEVSVMNDSPWGGELDLTHGCRASIGKNQVKQIWPAPDKNVSEGIRCFPWCCWSMNPSPR